MIKEITQNQIKEALDLVNRVFSEFVAVDYSAQGRDTFENYLKTKDAEFASDIKSGHKNVWGYYKNGEIAGVIAVRDNSHISLLFVDKKHHRKGIAHKLFNHLLKKIKQDGITKITVNSSPYATEIYERLGFVKIGERQEKDGIIYIPMAYEEDLLRHLDKFRTTEMGAERIKRNLGLQISDTVSWCKAAILNAEKSSLIFYWRKGKNWYIHTPDIGFTVNAGNLTIITAHKLKTKIYAMNEECYPVLKEFLYQAIFVPEGVKPPPREIIDEPEIFIYIKDFGKQAGDLGVVAEHGGQIIGAAWIRIIPPSRQIACNLQDRACLRAQPAKEARTYGHLDTDTPELVISMFPEYRGRGIGTKLMKKLFELLREKGYKQTSLSVQKDNPAVRFYKRLGYKITGDSIDHAGNEDFLMVRDFEYEKRNRKD